MVRQKHDWEWKKEEIYYRYIVMIAGGFPWGLCIYYTAFFLGENCYIAIFAPEVGGGGLGGKGSKQHRIHAVFKK